MKKKRYGLHRYYVLGPSQVEIVEKSTCKKRCLDGLFQCPTNLNIYLQSTSDSLSEDDDLEEESDEPESSDLPGPAQSREPGPAEPVWARPGQAIGDGSGMALARLRVAESLREGGVFLYATRVISEMPEDLGTLPK